MGRAACSAPTGCCSCCTAEQQHVHCAASMLLQSCRATAMRHAAWPAPTACCSCPTAEQEHVHSAASDASCRRATAMGCAAWPSYLQPAAAAVLLNNTCNVLPLMLPCCKVTAIGPVAWPHPYSLLQLFHCFVHCAEFGAAMSQGDSHGARCQAKSLQPVAILQCTVCLLMLQCSPNASMSAGRQPWGTLPGQPSQPAAADLLMNSNMCMALI
jgi:hypothetical protein